MLFNINIHLLYRYYTVIQQSFSAIYLYSLGNQVCIYVQSNNCLFKCANFIDLQSEPKCRRLHFVARMLHFAWILVEVYLFIYFLPLCGIQMWERYFFSSSFLFQKKNPTEVTLYFPIRRVGQWLQSVSPLLLIGHESIDQMLFKDTWENWTSFLKSSTLRIKKKKVGLR